MVNWKAQLTEFEAEFFKFFEACCASVYDALSPEAFVSALWKKLKNYPVSPAGYLITGQAKVPVRWRLRLPSDKGVPAS